MYEFVECIKKWGNQPVDWGVYQDNNPELPTLTMFTYEQEKGNRYFLICGRSGLIDLAFMAPVFYYTLKDIQRMRPKFLIKVFMHYRIVEL